MIHSSKPCRLFEVFEGSRMNGEEDCSRTTGSWQGRCTRTAEAQMRTFARSVKRVIWCSKILLLGWLSIGLSLDWEKLDTIPCCWCQRCLELYDKRKACRRCLGSRQATSSNPQLWPRKRYKLFLQARCPRPRTKRTILERMRARYEGGVF